MRDLTTFSMSAGSLIHSFARPALIWWMWQKISHLGRTSTELLEAKKSLLSGLGSAKQQQQPANVNVEKQFSSTETLIIFFLLVENKRDSDGAIFVSCSSDLFAFPTRKKRIEERKKTFGSHFRQRKKRGKKEQKKERKKMTKTVNHTPKIRFDEHFLTTTSTLTQRRKECCDIFSLKGLSTSFLEPGAI